MNVRMKGEMKLKTSIFWVDPADKTYTHEHINGWSRKGELLKHE
jgi:hypothetical protein